MDATPSNALALSDADAYSDLLVKSENPEFPFPLQQKNTVKKYTKLPEFDLESKGLWPRQNYTVQPRSRRFITFQDPITVTDVTDITMSAEVDLPNKKMAGNVTNRKIVSIVEDDDHDLKLRFSKVGRFCSVQKISRASTAKLTTPKFDVKDSNRNTSFINMSSKYSRESKPSAKFTNTFETKDTKPFNNRRKPANISTENNKPKTVRRKDIPPSKSARSNIFKNAVPQTNSEKEVALIKSKLNENTKKPRMTLAKKPKEKVNLSKLIKPDHKSRNPVLTPKDFCYKTSNVIHVPIEDVSKTTLTPLSSYVATPQCLSSAEQINQMDENVSNDSPELKVNANTITEPEPRVIYKYLQSTDVQTELIKETFDNLDIPNVTLTKTESDGESRNKSLTNVPMNALGGAEDVSAKPNLESSYIISRATLTYTTEQKFDLQVVGSNDDDFSNHTPSPLSYPINVVSVYKKEMQGEDCETKVGKSIDYHRKHNERYKNRTNNIKTLDCCYAPIGNQLIKPSDIISTISVNNGIMQSDFICDQFQRELNFIDSFFESLIYLDGVLTKKYVAGDKINEVVSGQDLVESSNGFGYENFISNFRNDSNADDDSQTMASKNLFLLNILIRDEQRRAKNLLFVLKRREDALKNFTKSQILYLEHKKKQENTDISALKKKQRGALLKLQHECGEMQRMRRALLTLSDKRKLTLMKTKKDLELKLKSNLDVDTNIIGKKLLKRSASADRASPLKCFDLSSSSGEDSSSSRRHSGETISPEPVNAKVIVSAEKSIQTGDTTLVDESTNTADENFIVVDGGYLNILFHNLSLPRIFSGGKQYEVNEPALKNIVDSCNSQQALNNSKTVQVHAFIDNFKNRESDVSSSPSTARSLLDEFDQYYKVLPRKYDSISSEESDFKISVCELKDAVCQVDSAEIIELHTESKSTDTLINSDFKSDKVTITAEEDIVVNKPCECEVIANQSMESIKVFESCHSEVFEEDVESSEVFVISPTGPLPVPAGEASADASTDAPSWHPVCTSVTTSTSNTCLITTNTDLPAERDPSVTLCEAEELRKQQLAIEKEIKELEQQQCMVVREIPDKPPPPYTPPAPPRQFKLDDATKTTINMYMNMDVEDYAAPKEPFDAFVQDFCNEALERTRQEQSDLPWDACNLAPPKPPLDRENLAEATVADLQQVLAGAKPTVISGISTRRSDHIDDVLFTEWQRVEPEWTSLHKDEAVVKNLVFESIFQRILTDTVDEYKRSVLSDQPAND